jgi:hypothetical protein
MDTADIVSMIRKAMKPDTTTWKLAESANEIIEVVQNKKTKRIINMIKKNLDSGYSFLPPESEQALKKILTNNLGLYNVSFYGGWYACIAAYLISPAYKEILHLQNQKVKSKPNITINRKIKLIVREVIIWSLENLRLNYYENNINIMLSVKPRKRDINEEIINQIIQNMDNIREKMNNVKEILTNIKGGSNILVRSIVKFTNKFDNLYAKVATTYGWAIQPNVLPNQRLEEVANKILDEEEPKLE